MADGSCVAARAVGFLVEFAVFSLGFICYNFTNYCYLFKLVIVIKLKIWIKHFLGKQLVGAWGFG